MATRLLESGAQSYTISSCQACGGEDLEPLLFLGYLPPVNTMPAVGEPPREQPAFPAQWLHCRRCTLVQLSTVVAAEVLFPPSYPYTSGTTRILRENFAELYQECRSLVSLEPSDLCVDIGSNDGTLLANFQAGGHRVRGIEPTNAGLLAAGRGIPTHIAFFDEEAVSNTLSTDGQARIVTAANCFAHIDDVNRVVENVLDLLADDGLFVTESHYLLSLVETLQYDTVYHEHMRYYSLSALENLFGRHDLEIVHARRIPTHGGSIRVYAARQGRHAVRPTVAELLSAEAAALSLERLRGFQAAVTRSKLALYAHLHRLKAEGKRIFGVGAPSRASTLINYVGLDHGILDCVVEVTGSRKLGKCIPGTLIPVVDEARLFQEQPECALLLSWHIADELAPKLRGRGYRGEFLIPLPEPRVVAHVSA
jgi:SAM-dependent methyltransferase